jgi:RNA polymerase sigma-70 factor (ECF subfamily)
MLFAKRSRAEFERLFLPHLDAAFNLARFLTRNAQDAEDVVQESYLRALRAFDSFRSESHRPWLLAIVRNTAFTWLQANRGRTAELPEDIPAAALTPESATLSQERATGLKRCIEKLPPDFREAIVLREIEELSYREISKITGVPAGTVMSRLSRARARLAGCLKFQEHANVL